ncbi:MAG: DUF4363 family protein [Clostridia bacterium]|nr:DUF4363 family protein [Clostridia bacterium]
MKTFIAAIVLLAVTAALIIWNAAYINKIAEQMLLQSECFPHTVKEFDENHEEISAAADAIFSLWDECFGRLSATISFENIDRVDDAVAELYSAAKNHDGEAFIPAAIKFSDALRRLKRLENFNFESIF